MKAFRNIAGQVVEIDVDIDLAGNPILPPNTTTDKKPSIPEGHYATVVGDRWVVIARPVQVVTFEMKQTEKLEQLSVYRKWLLDQPVEHQERNFDADEQARARVSQAIVSYQALNELPLGWVDADNKLFPIETFEELCGLALVIANAFQERFFTTAALRTSILTATTEAELEEIDCPGIPMDDMY